MISFLPTEVVRKRSLTIWWSYSCLVQTLKIYNNACTYSMYIYIIIQWNLSIADTRGTAKSQKPKVSRLVRCPHFRGSFVQHHIISSEPTPVSWLKRCPNFRSVLIEGFHSTHKKPWNLHKCTSKYVKKSYETVHRNKVVTTASKQQPYTEKVEIPSE